MTISALLPRHVPGGPLQSQLPEGPRATAPGTEALAEKIAQAFAASDGTMHSSGSSPVPDGKGEALGTSGSGTGDASQALAKALANVLNGPTLELDKIDPAQMQALVDASPRIWNALATATQQAHPPIGSVTLPVSTALAGNAELMKALCKGMGALPELRRVDVALPRDNPPTSLNLSALPATSALSVTVPGRPGLTVYVPKGTSVASSTLGPSSGKAFVQFMTDGKADGQPVTLVNHVYARQPKEFASTELAGKTWTTNLNGGTAFKDGNVQASKLESGDIQCRHLVARWLDDRADYHAKKDQQRPQAVAAQPPTGAGDPLPPSRGRGKKRMVEQADSAAKRKAVAPSGGTKPGPSGAASQRFSYAAYSDHKGLQEHVRSSTEQDYRRAPGFAIFTADAFGEMIQSLLKEMGEKGPANRQFMLSDTEHVMGVDLQVKTSPGGQHEYVVNFYDPNRTITHLRGKLDTKGLEALATQPLDFWPRDKSGTGFGGNHTLFAWPPRASDAGPAPSVTARVFGRKDGNFDANFVYAALKTGDASLVQKHLPGCLREDMSGTDENNLAFGYGYAMERGSLEAACAYVDAVLGSGLPERSLLNLLSNSLKSPLYSAMQSGEPAVVSEVTSRILASGALSERAKCDLLTARGPRPSGDSHMLKVVATQAVVPFEAPGLATRQHLAIHAFTTSIMRSGLDLSHKHWLLGKDSHIHQSMLRGNPGAAAAIACAVLEHAKPGEAQVLLEASGKGYSESTGIAQILEALAEAQKQELQKGTEPVSGTWIKHILSLLPKAQEAGVLNPAEVLEIRAKYGTGPEPASTVTPTDTGMPTVPGSGAAGTTTRLSRL